MNLVELKCKNCGASLSPESVVERLAMARCSHCNAVFALDLPPDPAGQPDRVPKMKVARPDAFEVNTEWDTITLTLRWLTPITYFILFFAIIWNGFMVFWHIMSWSTGAWFMSLFGSLHTAVGVGLIYKVVADFINRTTITANRQALTVVKGPLPWPGNKHLHTSGIRQLYGKEKVTHGKNGTHTTYAVEVVMQDDTREVLIKGLDQAEQALFVEQEIERFLGIRDREVPGELRR